MAMTAAVMSKLLLQYLPHCRLHLVAACNSIIMTDIIGLTDYVITYGILQYCYDRISDLATTLTAIRLLL